MTQTLRTRREVLAAGLAGAAGLMLASCSSSTVRRAVSIKPAGSDIGAIDHIVCLMLENRSFDHYFGAYPGVRGFDDHHGSQLGEFAQSWPDAPHSANNVLLPFHLDTRTNLAECTYDLSHQWTAQHSSWDHGTMNRFVATHTEAAVDGPQYGTLTMGYYLRDDLPFHWALADAFTLCDGYHCSVMGPTHPNRLYALSAHIDPAGLDGGPYITTDSNNSVKFSVSWESMPERLQAAGIPWKVYNPAGGLYQPSSPLAMSVSDNIMLYFKKFSDPTSELYKRAFSPTFPGDFGIDVANGSLPAVSWIVPPIGYDEHPPAPPAFGAWFVHQVLSALVSNPKVWAKTALFVMYDENDGFFDHVAPPVPPAGTEGEYLTVDTLPGSAGGVRGPIGLGVRVPMLVLSPFSRGGRVVHDTFDHTSQLRLIETRFGVPVPNLTAWRRSTVGDLSSTLGRTSDLTVPKLPATPAKPLVVSRGCTSLDILEYSAPNSPTYPVPSPQQMPTQV